MPDAVQPFAEYAPRRRPRTAEPAGVVLTEATARDIPRLASLQAAVRGGAPERWAERIGRLAGGDAGVVVVARVDAVIAGYGCAAVLPEHPEDGAPGGPYLNGVTVAPRWRRRGVGLELTRRRLRWAWQRSAEAWCFVSAGNPASLDLHLALGFHEVRRGPAFQGVTFDCGEGVLLCARRGYAQ
jgi:phosphinothricin acetyltransferase